MNEPASNAPPIHEIDAGAQIRKILKGAREKRFLLLMLGVLGLIVGAFVATLIPELYEARTLLLVRQRQILTDSTLLKAIENKTLAQKEQTLAQELKSFSWIQNVLERLEWPEYAAIRNSPADVQEMVDKIRSDKYFDVEMDTDTAGELLVNLSFRWFDPQRAHDFVRECRWHWLETRWRDNLDYKRFRLQEIAGILKRHMDRHEQARGNLKMFQQAHETFQVASDQDSDIKLKTGLQDKLNTLEGMISNADEYIRSLDEQMKGQQQFTQELEESANAEYQSRLTQLQAAQVLLEQQSATKSERHPAVQKAKADYEAAKKALAEVAGLEARTSRTVSVPNPEYLKLNAELATKRADLAGWQSERDLVQKQLTDVIKRLESRPGLDQELLHLQNEYDMTLADVNGVRPSVTALDEEVRILEEGGGAGISRDSERALLSAGAFQILEHPVVPKKPVGLPKFLYSLIGMIVFLAIGLAVVTFTQMTRSTYDEPEEVTRSLHLPLLGSVAPIATAAEMRRQRLAMLSSTVGSLLLVGTLGYFVFLVTTTPDRLPPSFRSALQELKDTFR